MLFDINIFDFNICNIFNGKNIFESGYNKWYWVNWILMKNVN